jgi:hypothetical protein
MGDDEDLDIALEQTFPASDPPSFMGSVAIVGNPDDRRSAPDREGSKSPRQRVRPARHSR